MREGGLLILLFSVVVDGMVLNCIGLDWADSILHY